MDSAIPTRDPTESPVITIRIFAGRFTPPQQQALIARARRALRTDSTGAAGPAPCIRVVEVHAPSGTAGA